VSPAVDVLRPAIFLDRDGVIIENRADYVKSVAEVQFIPGALAALAGARHWPGAIVVITNQSAVGRGVITLATADAINAYVRQQVEAVGGRLDGIFMCPHAPAAGCACRKPAPELLHQAARKLHLDLSASIMIGDALTDVQAGHAAGTQTVLVRTGRGAEQAPRLESAGLGHVPVAADLAAALADFTATKPKA